MIYLLLVLTLILIIRLFLSQSKFGKAPAGARLEKIKKSNQYRGGKFQNTNITPDLTEGATFFSVLVEFLFRKNKRRQPKSKIPSNKIDLLHLDPKKDILIWFGHSSYFIQLDGKKFLIDPVLSGSASPVKFTTPSFEGADVYQPGDFPSIDYLFISHDHWDHLDHETVIALKPKIDKVICGLGTAAHLEYWGYESNRIIEKDWNEEIELKDGFKVYITPARHFSGRSIKRNQVLWVSFVLQTPSLKIYLGADSGYDSHFNEIGDTHGPFDLAILECGQYDKSWKYIHMMPEEVVQASLALKTKKTMPVHWGKFALSNHAWDDSIIRVVNAAKKNSLPLITPMIGEEVNLKEERVFSEWWKTID